MQLQNGGFLLNMLHDTFQQLDTIDDVVLIDNKIFNAVQMINQIIEEFEPRGNDLNFSGKPTWLKKYFKQKNVHGIFNRVELKFTLRQGIKCELLMPANISKQKGKLEIRVTIDFSTSKKQMPFRSEESNKSDYLSMKERKNSKNIEIKVSLDFYPDEAEIEEASTSDITTSTLNNVYWMVNQNK